MGVLRVLEVRAVLRVARQRQDAIICMLNWYCCGFCAQTNLYAASLGGTCGIVPHALMTFFCPFISCWFTRYNLRTKYGIPGNLIGDLVCVWCCGCCSSLQHLRASQISDWNVLDCKITPM